jgi:hypothetical protein
MVEECRGSGRWDVLGWAHHRDDAVRKANQIASPHVRPLGDGDLEFSVRERVLRVRKQASS